MLSKKAVNFTFQAIFAAKKPMETIGLSVGVKNIIHSVETDQLRKNEKFIHRPEIICCALLLNK